jgi:hypothetical protein
VRRRHPRPPDLTRLGVDPLRRDLRSVLIQSHYDRHQGPPQAPRSEHQRELSALELRRPCQCHLRARSQPNSATVSYVATRMVYVELLGEGVEVWCPVEAVVDGDAFVLPVTAPEGERWRFAPGSRVRCELREPSDGQALVAAEIAADDPVRGRSRLSRRRYDRSARWQARRASISQVTPAVRRVHTSPAACPTKRRATCSAEPPAPARRRMRPPT